MSTEIKELTVIEEALLNDKIVARVNGLLKGDKQKFKNNVLQIFNEFQDVEPYSLINACLTATVLDLSLNQSFGEAWIVPYYNSKTKQKEAQFQLGWRGLVQMCLRTNQYQSMNIIEVYENQFESYNSLTQELKGDFEAEGEGTPIGYACYFSLNNGFEKTVYWKMEKIKKHAKKYSKSFGKSSKGWNDEDQFDAMAMKTVLKNTLGKWGPKSSKLNTAIMADQSVQNLDGDYEYVDYDEVKPTELSYDKDLMDRIEGCTDMEALELIYRQNKKEISLNHILKTAVHKRKAAMTIPEK